MEFDEASVAATKLANALDTDVIFYTGPSRRPYDAHLIDLCEKRTCRKNVILFLCSQGGDADAAYRIGRCLQRKYERFTVVVGGWCKSAGTLLVIGAHELVMADQAELGPLDVQIGRKDELWESDSGLTVLTAIAKLEEKCFELFESGFLKLKMKSDGRITLKTATELAHKLAIGTITPIVSQIDPLQVGEVTRAMNIGLEYANRLAERSENIHRSLNPEEDSIQKLANGYPTHGFVIDREEAAELFINVRSPNVAELEILEKLSSPARRPPRDEAVLTYLSEPPNIQVQNAAENNRPDNASESETERGEGIAGTEQAKPPDPQEKDSKLHRPAAA
jgi:hypothetical protein